MTIGVELSAFAGGWKKALRAMKAVVLGVFPLIVVFGVLAKLLDTGTRSGGYVVDDCKGAKEFGYSIEFPGLETGTVDT